MGKTQKPLNNLPVPTRFKCFKSPSVGSTGSMFAQFESEKLHTEERLYLQAARLGDYAALKELAAVAEPSDDGSGGGGGPGPGGGSGGVGCRVNVNCVDYMGRNALHLAVDSENVECIELLLEKLDMESVEEALLHAVSKGSLDIVRIIADHPNFISRRRSAKMAEDSCFFRTENHQYSPDVTPLMLAAHRNDHELIQLFLSRQETIERPHAIHCQCHDCQVKQNSDSLKRSLSRLNAYRALSSPAFMALSSEDPITTTFELRQEMMQVAEAEKEFKTEYVDCAEQCMNFACELMDLCRGTQEVEAVLGEETSENQDPLARLRLAIQYNEKKFVAHPNCQQHMVNLWYGKEMTFLQSLSRPQKLTFSLAILPVMPFICLTYIINPYTKLAKQMRCPVSKFVMHTMSHFIFLLLLALATFRLDSTEVHVFHGGNDSASTASTTASSSSSSSYSISGFCFNPAAFPGVGVSRTVLRPTSSTITSVQILIIFWIIGLIWIECKQLYSAGLREHFLQYYNYMDFCILALYLASYCLRFVTQYWLRLAHDHFFIDSGLGVASINQLNDSQLKLLILESKLPKHRPYAYFLDPCRFSWLPSDPLIIAEILFAVANVLSFARTTYVMPSHELLGPLQISLGRMFADIARFIVLFLLVLFAFMVGMTNLYRYYGTQMINMNTPASESFKGLPETVQTLFFSIFGLTSLDKLKINSPGNEKDSPSTLAVERVGQIMFATYLVVVIIVLVNILIAMMSHSFEAIQGDSDMEWKFARTKLWLSYIDESSTLPVPFNMIPTPKSLKYVVRVVKQFFVSRNDMQIPIKYDFTKRRDNLLPTDLDPISAGILQRSKATYTEILQRLVRRYLFKQDRLKYEKPETVSRLDDSKSAEDEDELLSCIKEESNAIIDAASDAASASAATEDATSNSSRLSPSYLSAAEQSRILRRSSSSEVMRQLTRRATMKRSTKRSVVNTARSSCASQLDSIQRGQKLLDARLQDLQAASGKKDETVVKENVLHVRHLLTETQRALDILVKSMASTQNAIQTMATVVTAIYSRMCTTASATANAGPDVAMVIEVLSTQTSPQLQLSSASPPSDTREMPTEAAAASATAASAAAMLLQLPQQKTDDDQSTSRPVVLKNTLRLQASTPGSYSEGQQITRKGGNMSRPEMVQLVNRLRHLPSTKSADAVNYKKHGRPS